MTRLRVWTDCTDYVKGGDVYAATRTKDSRQPSGEYNPNLKSLMANQKWPCGHGKGKKGHLQTQCPRCARKPDIGSESFLSPQSDNMILSSNTDYVTSTVGRGTSVVTGSTAFISSGIYKVGDGTGVESSKGGAFTASGKYARRGRAALGRRQIFWDTLEPKIITNSKQSVDYLVNAAALLVLEELWPSK